MGKPVPNSAQSYLELREITDAYYGGKIEKPEASIRAYAILDKYVVRLRDKDGRNPVMTLKPPDDDTLVMGIRYIKESGRTTEDHFLFRRDTNMYRCKGREIKSCRNFKALTNCSSVVD